MTHYEKLNAQLDILNIVYHINDEEKTYENVAKHISELFEQIDITVPSVSGVPPTIKQESNIPLINGYFVPLKVLSNKVTKKDQDEYDEKIKEYDRAMRKYESMGIGDPPLPPEEINGTKEYHQAYINFKDMHIINWLSDFDDEYNCPAITVEYTTPYTPGMTNTINIQMQENEWLRLIQKLGGHVN